MLNTSAPMISFTLTAILRGGRYYFYIADEETEAQLTSLQLGSKKARRKECFDSNVLQISLIMKYSFG